MSENQPAVYTEEYLNRLENLMSDDSFTAKLKGKANAEDVRKLFADNGVILDDITLNTIKEKMQYYADHGELDEDMLEFVSGGMKMNFWNRVKGSFSGGFIAGATTANPGVGLLVGMGLFVFSYIR